MIMKMCWNLEPTERPTFSRISQMINRLLGGQDEQQKVSWPEILSEIKNQTSLVYPTQECFLKKLLLSSNS